MIAVAGGVRFLSRVGIPQGRAPRNVPPLGVILGHVAFFRVGTGYATGRPWALRALGVGYLLLLVELILFLWYYSGIHPG